MWAFGRQSAWLRWAISLILFITNGDENKICAFRTSDAGLEEEVSSPLSYVNTLYEASCPAEEEESFRDRDSDGLSPIPQKSMTASELQHVLA